MKHFIEVTDRVGLTHIITIQHIVEMIDVSEMEGKDYKTVIYLSNGSEIAVKESIKIIFGLII